MARSLKIKQSSKIIKKIPLESQLTDFLSNLTDIAYKFKEMENVVSVFDKNKLYRNVKLNQKFVKRKVIILAMNVVIDNFNQI